MQQHAAPRERLPLDGVIHFGIQLGRAAKAAMAVAERQRDAVDRAGQAVEQRALGDHMIAGGAFAKMLAARGVHRAAAGLIGADHHIAE